MSSYVFVNGVLLPEAEALVHFSDLAIHRGFAIFDFFRTQNGVPFMLEDHLDRFENSAADLNLSLHYSRSSISNYVDELVSHHRYETAGVKLILTGGESQDGLTPAQSNFFISIQPITFPDQDIYNKGARLISTEYRRDIPTVKTVNYAKVISMRDQVDQADAVDVLFKFQGEVYETSRSNFFLVHDDIIKTRGQDVLSGITRKIVLQLAQEAGFKVDQGSPLIETVFLAEESLSPQTGQRPSQYEGHPEIPRLGLDPPNVHSASLCAITGTW